HEGPVNIVKFSPDARFIASGGSDAKLMIWSIQKKRCEDIVCCNANGDITDIVWVSLQPNALSLIFACADGTIHIMNSSLEEFKHIRTINGFAGPVEKIDFDPFQQRLAAVGEGELKVWDVKIDCKFLSCTNGLNADVDLGSISLHATKLSTEFIAKTVHFFDQGRGILVGFLESHRM
ncbi:hypothetical protein M422DRAFT_195187, partial [Sphaerobolus stellatus SS14]